MESATEPGRREQNKRRTHEALIHAAARLFQENGYEATTVRDIAAAAGVGERTFFRYFPSKESLILQHVRDFIPMLEEAIRARPQGETPLAALRNAVLELAGRDDWAAGILLAGPQPLSTAPSGRGERFLLFDLEEAVASAFLDRMTVDGADPAAPESVLRASVLARAGVGVLRALRLTYARLPEAKRDEIGVLDFADAAFATLTDAEAGTS
ncbi:MULTISPECIES: TetR/AcrR family transcriptional regulator [Streptomyces]|uniref:TetR/AcrR family transcriptional regulator n=1 Tax=Streptomyces TaxID=1883 RepID=UPI0013D9B5F4|nr:MULTISPECIES: TetR family transcriptional regulator [unclassified Streptomyces]NMI62640.1 TetR/AcrR family transcriptional regulator [Streptomyces sp. RLA2-12]